MEAALPDLGTSSTAGLAPEEAALARDTLSQWLQAYLDNADNAHASADAWWRAAEYNLSLRR